MRRNKYAFTGAFNDCKEQISAEARAHLLREIARLKKLGHRHIVQFVKSYQRGDRYGILLKPAATTDLKKLDRYRRKGLDYNEDARNRRRDRIVLKPVLLTAFGYLSRGLAHIHSCNIRHKDIKPASILYEKALDKNPARFLWADFGLAYDFGNSGNSKTVSKNRHRYSQRLWRSPRPVKQEAKLIATLQTMMRKMLRSMSRRDHRTHVLATDEFLISTHSASFFGNSQLPGSRRTRTQCS